MVLLLLLSHSWSRPHFSECLFHLFRLLSLLLSGAYLNIFIYLFHNIATKDNTQLQRVFGDGSPLVTRTLLRFFLTRRNFSNLFLASYSLYILYRIIFDIMYILIYEPLYIYRHNWHIYKRCLLQESQYIQTIFLIKFSSTLTIFIKSNNNRLFHIN